MIVEGADGIVMIAAAVTVVTVVTGVLVLAPVWALRVQQLLPVLVVGEAIIVATDPHVEQLRRRQPQRCLQYMRLRLHQPQPL